jgi:SAM-dependent methyltransferase
MAHKKAAAAAVAAGPRRGGAAAFIASSANAADANAADAANDTNPQQRFALYQRAVQHPEGDLSWALKFHRLYALPGETAPPLHLREDFSGTSLLCARWLRASPLRTALGIDLDKDALAWGQAHNFQGVGSRVCLVHANVLDDVQGPKMAIVAPPPGERGGDDDDDNDEAENERVLRLRADLVLCMNYCLCLMHTRADAVRYLRRALKALAAGETEGGGGGGNPSTGLLLFDLLGGHTAERAGVAFDRRNPQTGARFRWEQARYDPLARRLRSHLRLLPESGGGGSSKKTKRRALEPPVVATFTYDWRLWTVPEAIDLLREAGHTGDVRVWVRRVREDDGGATVRRVGGESGGESGGSGSGSGSDDPAAGKDDDDDDDDEYVEYRPGGAGVDLQGLAEGWSAYVVAVVRR